MSVHEASKPPEPRPKRRYRLSPKGRASLLKSAARNQPWLQSTGPRTASGKERAKMNAYQHGARSEEAAARRKTIRLLLEFLREPRESAADIASFLIDPFTAAHLEQMRRLLS
jgi:hypothetical protein